MRKLSNLALIAITISAIVNLRGISIMASNGYLTLILSVAAALFFMLPSAFVCAKLSIQTQQRGGVYEWVQRTFGQRWGFVAIWMEWINNVVGFPASLASLVGMFYLFIQGSMPNPGLFTLSMLVLVWFGVLYNHWPLVISSSLNIIGTLGTLLIATLILVLGVVWLTTNPGSAHSLHPDITGHWSNQVALFVSFIGAYSGMQITGFHVADVAEPKKQYPIALTVSAILILVMMLGSSFIMALLIPREQLNVIAGIEQMVQLFFIHFHWPHLGNLISLFVLLALLASFSAWFIGPARGMQVALSDAGMKNSISRLNRFGMPTGLLILQGVITSVLVMLFVILPSVKAAFFLLIAMTSQFTAFMYVMIFAAGYRLIARTVFSKFVCVLGMLSCSVGFMVGIFAPSQMKWMGGGEYSLMILAGDVLIIVLGWVFAKKLGKIGSLHQQF